MPKANPPNGRRNTICLTVKGLVFVVCALIPINMYFGNFEKIRNVQFTTYNFNSITFREAGVNVLQSAMFANHANGTPTTLETPTDDIPVNFTKNDVMTNNATRNDVIISKDSNSSQIYVTAVSTKNITISENNNNLTFIKQKVWSHQQVVDIRKVAVLHRDLLETIVRSASRGQVANSQSAEGNAGPAHPAAVPRPVSGQSGQFSCHVCFKHDYMYLLDNPDICKETVPGQSIDILFLVLTVHGDFEAREAIRSTWLSVSKQNTGDIRYAFLLGQLKVPDTTLTVKVNSESEKYRDIIQEDFVDTYMNLTLKSIMGYKWAATKCPRAKVVVKTDDDMFINVDRLKVIIRENDHVLRNTVLGSCSDSAKPIRSQKSKWYASPQSYRENSYPGFCSGTCYLTGMDVVQKVYKASESVPFFHLEDVYMGLCLRKVNAKVKNVPGFNRGRVRMDPCVYKKGNMVTSHQVPPKMLVHIWNLECHR